MGKVKTIGRGPDNDLRFSNSDISCNHAKVTLLDNGDFLAEDLDSTNGTFVNGYRINKAVISTLDELRLSESTIVNQVELFGLKGLHSKLVKSDPLDFSDEFNLLRYVWDDFQKTRINIKKKYQKKITLIRAGITLAHFLYGKYYKFFIYPISILLKTSRSSKHGRISTLFSQYWEAQSGYTPPNQ